MKKNKLDSEEKTLLVSYDRGEWRPVENKAAEIARLQKYAHKTLAHKFPGISLREQRGKR